MDSPLVSVIVPTRNRQKYAKMTIEQILSLNENIEIVVQDNSDDESLFTELKDYINANKLKYNYEKTMLPFSENYNRAAEQASGEFLCAIGDDDGVLPNIISCAKWMMDKGIDAVKPAKDQVYYYPGNINKKRNACIGYGKYTGSYYFLNPESSLISLLNDGGCEYLDKDLPGSYHGLISMQVMDEVKRRTGKYYSGLTPDMYSVACLSLIPDIRFAILDYPITLPGVCPNSGSAASDSGKHVGQLKDAPHLKALPNYNWSELVPKYYSVETIWAETMIYAIRKMGREDLIDKYFNQDKLTMHLYRNNYFCREDILKSLSSDLKSRVLDCCGFAMDEHPNKVSSVLANASIKTSGKRKVVRKVGDISAAINILDSELISAGKYAPWDR